MTDGRLPDPPETIETPRLLLRRPNAGDDEAVYAYASDPLVTRLMDWPTHTTIETSRRFLERCAEGWTSGTEITWLLTLRPDDRAVGAIACRPRGENVEFGYVLRRDVHGRGLATEAAQALVGWLTSLPGVRRVEATCDVENAASARVLERSGLKRERVLPGWGARPNLGPEPRDAFLYAWERCGEAATFPDSQARSPAPRREGRILAMPSPSPEEAIQGLVDRETDAWNRQDAEALVSLFHPDMVWPWPPDAASHDPALWVFPLGRFDRQRWKRGWEDLFRDHELVHNRRATVRIVVSEEGDGGFAVVDVDTLWRHRTTGETFHWKGRACKGYTKVGERWCLILHTGLLEYGPGGPGA